MQKRDRLKALICRDTRKIEERDRLQTQICRHTVRKYEQYTSKKKQTRILFFYFTRILHKKRQEKTKISCRHKQTRNRRRKNEQGRKKRLKHMQLELQHWQILQLALKYLERWLPLL
jgi:hypothetical protein